jgi:hypothetical protein
MGSSQKQSGIYGLVLGFKCTQEQSNGELECCRAPLGEGCFLLARRRALFEEREEGPSQECGCPCSVVGEARKTSSRLSMWDPALHRPLGDPLTPALTRDLPISKSSLNPDSFV